MEVRETQQKVLLMDKTEAEKMRKCFEYLQHRMTRHPASRGIVHLEENRIDTNFCGYVLMVLDEWKGE